MFVCLFVCLFVLTKEYTVNKREYFFKVDSMPITQKAFNAAPFGRQIEYFETFREFKSNNSKSIWLSQKRRSTQAALKEFLTLYEPAEFYTMIVSGCEYRDDSFEVWYRRK